LPLATSRRRYCDRTLIGVFWAAGLSAAHIDELSMQGGPLTVFDPSPFADRGWIHGRRLQDYVDQGVGGRRLQDLPRRLGAHVF
jgi:NTE family protein